MTRSDSRPLYIQTAETIEQIIERDRLGTGSQLPGEAALAERIGVSRSTVREALRELELTGRIQRIHGRGTLVTGTAAPIVTWLSTLDSLESLAARQGWLCGTEHVHFDSVPAPPEVATALCLGEQASVTYLSRVKTRDWRPVCWMETWLPQDQLSLEELRAQFRDSVVDLLVAGAGGVRLDHAVAEVSAAAADEATSAALQIPIGAPLAVIVEVFYDSDGRSFCYSRNAYVPNSVRLEVIRRPVPAGIPGRGAAEALHLRSGLPSEKESAVVAGENGHGARQGGAASDRGAM